MFVWTLLPQSQSSKVTIKVLAIIIYQVCIAKAFLFYSMYLIPLDNDTVYYNATALDVSSLATIFLLAIAYHPTYSNLLYLLYGCTSLASPGSTYGNINVMVRNMATKEFLQNTTITQNIKCSRYCEIKATDNLFLIESQSLVVIYRLSTDQLVDALSPAATYSKGTTYLISQLATHADIYKNRYVMLDDSTLIFTFGQVNSSGVVLKTLDAGSNISDIVSVGMTDKWVYTAVNYTNISVILYSCVACIFNDTWSDVKKLVIRTGVTVAFNYRLYQGGQTSQSNVTNAYIFVGSGDGDSRKYYINQSTYQQDPNISVYRIAAVSSANSYQHVAYGSSVLISRLFAYNQSDQKLQLISFDWPVYLVALSSDSKVLALHNAEDNWNVKQYQMVSDCALYATNISSFTNGTPFCACVRYDSQNLCAYNGTSTDNSTGNGTNTSNSTGNGTSTNTSIINGTTTDNNTGNGTSTNTSIINGTSTNTSIINGTSTDTATGSSSSFPIAAVIGVVVGVVILAVSVVVVKKNYKKCLKRHRTPWKYNPVQLMSFEA